MQPITYLLALSSAALLAACTADAAGPSAANRVFRFSAIPNEDQKQLRAKYDPVAEYLTAKTGVKTEYVPAVKYDASVTMFTNDDIQLAWYGGFTGVQARRAVAGARAIVRGRIDANYRTYFIVPKGSKLTESANFPTTAKGMRFTFGAKTSTSGRLMPEYFIRQETGGAPGEFFKEINYSPSHTKTIELVKDGTWELGAVDFAVYDGLVKEGKLDPADCRVIWRSPAYADYQFTIRPDLDTEFGSGFTEQLTAALLEMDATMAGKFRRQKMVAATNADFAGILEVAQTPGSHPPE